MKNILTLSEIHKIDYICNKYNITNYTINKDGTIDVKGKVNLSFKKITHLPLKFNMVSDSFFCDYNDLTTLEGCPKSVGGSFLCDFNKLTSLKYSPLEIKRDFTCNENLITTLSDCNSKIGGSFDCSNNLLTSLKSDIIVKYDYRCSYNDKLPIEFFKIIKTLSVEESIIFFKYQNILGIWDDGYDQEVAQFLCDDIKDGLL